MLVKNNSKEEINNALLYLEKQIEILKKIIIELKETVKEGK